MPCTICRKNFVRIAKTLLFKLFHGPAILASPVSSLKMQSLRPQSQIQGIRICILKINPLSVVSFAIIFSHSERCLFTLFIVSFAVQKLLSLVRLHLFISVYICIILGVGHRGSCCDYVKECPAYVFSSCSLKPEKQTTQSKYGQKT